MDKLTDETMQSVQTMTYETMKNAVIDDNRYVGMCYVPMQQWEEIYDEETAYMAGTIFPCLDKPFWDGGHHRANKGKEKEGGCK